MKIKDIMSAPVFVVSPDENVARARNLMLRHKIGRLVIVEDNKTIGMVTKKDIVKRLNQAELQWRSRMIDDILFFFKHKTAYEIRLSLVGSEMCIRDSLSPPKKVREAEKSPGQGSGRRPIYG